jgi:hypothetical protein
MEAVQPTTPQIIFPPLSKLPKDSEAVLRFSLQTSSPIKHLKLTSNCAYSVFVNDNFIGDGGLRCAPNESIIDHFDVESSSVHIYLHYIGFKNSVWHRMLFPDPFFCDFDGTNVWKCEQHTSFLFGAKLSSQLPRQNIIPSVNNSISWNHIERNFIFRYHEKLFSDTSAKKHSLPSSFPKFTQVTNKKSYTFPSIYDFTKLSFKTGDNLMEVLHNINDPNVICYTLDLESTGLHKLFVTTSDPLVAYYSEIDHFDSAWNTHNRNKVWMSDAFINCTNSPSIEWRGCKYVHIVTTTTCKFSIKSLRKEYAFDWISKQLDDDS